MFGHYKEPAFLDLITSKIPRYPAKHEREREISKENRLDYIRDAEQEKSIASPLKLQKNKLVGTPCCMT
jgi:uncharacterized damage-inducible protein DinB